ncbi:MAG: extracellular solute-binding protein [Spirochaetales bacterium]|nr:extracellular solute-binding protein [Spirochaetales bacterium]
MRKIKRTLVLTVLMLLSVLIPSCHKNETKQQNQWQGGEVIFYLSGGDEFFRKAGELFYEEYGIKVNIVIAQDAVITRKIINEKELDYGTVDIYLSDSGLVFNQLDKAGTLSSIPASISGAEKVISTLDSDKILPLYGRIAVFAYDPLRIPAPPETWDAFNEWLDENPNRFGFTAIGGASGFSFRYSVMATLTGGWKQYTHGDEWIDPEKKDNWNSVWDWFSDHRDQYILTSTDYESLRLLSSGKLWLTSAFRDDVQAAIDKNELPVYIEMYLPDFGGLYLERGLVIPINSPNRKSAELFSAFLISEGMQVLMEEMLKTVSLQKGVSSFSINEDETGFTNLFPLPDPPYIQGLTEEFRKKVLYN